MAGFFKALCAVALLAVPLLVITAAPRLFELVVPTTSGQTTRTQAAGPPVRLAEPTAAATAVRGRFAPLTEVPPPTLAAPATTPTVAPTALPTPTGERIRIGDTGGLGAVLRSEPVTGRPVAALREAQVLDVVERQSIPGSGEWVHVRTAEGVDGWVTGMVAVAAPSATPAPLASPPAR
jgi:hypothetical protein